MKSTSLSVRSSSSFAHVAIPGVYSSHSTFTAAMVSPSASVCRVEPKPRAITSLCSGVRFGLTYSASTCDRGGVERRQVELKGIEGGR
eukprot:29787-Pelagococcus_subviridis.AAC.4